LSDIAQAARATHVVARLRGPDLSADLWLLFSPLNARPPDWLVEKSTELGARTLADHDAPHRGRKRPRGSPRLHRPRSAEQTERLDVPEIREALSLAKTLETWDAERPLNLLR